MRNIKFLLVIFSFGQTLISNNDLEDIEEKQNDFNIKEVIEEKKKTNVALWIIILISVAGTVVVAVSSYLIYRFCLKKPEIKLKEVLNLSFSSDKKNVLEKEKNNHLLNEMEGMFLSYDTEAISDVDENLDTKSQSNELESLIYMPSNLELQEQKAVQDRMEKKRENMFQKTEKEIETYLMELEKNIHRQKKVLEQKTDFVPLPININKRGNAKQDQLKKQISVTTINKKNLSRGELLVKKRKYEDSSRRRAKMHSYNNTK